VFTIIGRSLGFLGLSSEMDEAEAMRMLGGYVDAGDISSWAVNDTALLIKYGIVQGNNNTLNPRGEITRAEVAVILYNYLNAVGAI